MEVIALADEIQIQLQQEQKSKTQIKKMAKEQLGYQCLTCLVNFPSTSGLRKHLKSSSHKYGLNNLKEQKKSFAASVVENNQVLSFNNIRYGDLEVEEQQEYLRLLIISAQHIKLIN